jgi:outer membrane protein TolC
MSSSSPLVAVGISAIVLLGTASAAPAQSSQTNADTTNQKSSDVSDASSPQSRQNQATEAARSRQDQPSLPETLDQVSWAETTHAAASEENQPDKPAASIAIPSIKIFVSASQPEAAASPVAQVTSEDELEESGEPGEPEEPEEPTLPRVDPSNTINPPEQPTAPEPAQPAPDALPDDTPGDILNQDEDEEDAEVETPIAPVEPAAPLDPSNEREEPAPPPNPESLDEITPDSETPTPSDEDESPSEPQSQDQELEEEQDEAVDEELEDLETDEPQDQEADEIEAIEEDELIQPSDPARSSPDYLDPDANPLSFPTTPEEVELVGTQPLTLEQAIELGIRNNAELQTSRLELQRQQAALREAEANNYPDVNANVGLGYSASESAQQDTETVGGQEIPTDDIITPVQRSLGLEGSLEVSYPLYTSGRRPALIEAAERQVRFQELQVESDTEELIFEITSAYYNLQEADEEVQIFRATLEEAERSLRDAEALERAGVGTRFDVLQAQVDVANALQNLRNQESDQEIARRQLAERLNLNQTVTLAAADPIEVAGVWELDLEETIVAAYRNRAELEQQLVQREIAQQNRRAALAQLGPQVTVSTSYGLSNTLASDPDSLQEDAGFLSSFQAQLGVSMPIFEGGEARAQARQAEANIAIAETTFANQRDQIRFEVEQAYSQLNSNFENIQTTALAVQQAIEALRLARLRFQAGVGTQTDVLQAQTALTQARFNNLQAILNYNRALAALRRQVSNLPEGALNDVP